MQMALKRPHAISFSKKNVIRPFEDPSSLEFWADKNDASMFVVGQSSKKRPNNLALVRMFNNKVLDMCELGLDTFVGMNEFKVAPAFPFYPHKRTLHRKHKRIYDRT
jgi:ribosome production factor 2